MSDSVQPHRQQPTRLPCPWDSPGKNTEVGCHFLLQCMKVKSESEVAQSFPTLSDPMDCSLPGSSVHGFSRQEYWSGVPLPSLVTSSYIAFIILRYILLLFLVYWMFLITKVLLDFVKCFLCINWDDHGVFVLYSLKVVYCIDWFYMEPSLYSRNKSYFVMMSNYCVVELAW